MGYIQSRGEAWFYFVHNGLQKGKGKQSNPIYWQIGPLMFSIMATSSIKTPHQPIKIDKGAWATDVMSLACYWLIFCPPRTPLVVGLTPIGLISWLIDSGGGVAADWLMVAGRRAARWSK